MMRLPKPGWVLLVVLLLFGHPAVAALSSCVPIDGSPRHDLVPHLWHAEDAAGTW